MRPDPDAGRGSERAGARAVFVHLASGIGNVVLATPLLMALREMEFVIDVQVNGDYAETADLLRDWSALRNVRAAGSAPARWNERPDYVVPAIPPFYWPRYANAYRTAAAIVSRPPDALFYQDEQEYYLAFAKKLGYPPGRTPAYGLPIAPAEDLGVTTGTLVLAPGCKTGEMSAKRWPHFPDLAARFPDVAVVGTGNDLRRHDGTEMAFPGHVRSFVDRLSLRATAELLAAAGVVVSNDSGLGHVAGAVGTPTVMLFGPTPHHTLGRFPSNVTVLRAGLPCEPCWFGARFGACARRVDCLRDLNVETVAREAERCLGVRPANHAWS
jgi:ADP-heptose:LPS heptosyltransferase